MEQDEQTLDVQEEQQENEDVVIEETPTETPEETPESKADEGVKLSPAEYRHFKKWVAQSKPNPKPADTPPSPNVEEVVLLANGMPEQLVNELKAVAAVRKTTLIKAQSDPIFTAIKEKYEKDQKQEQASLPASRGAGNVKPQKDFNTPGLTREEHMAMFNKHL